MAAVNVALSPRGSAINATRISDWSMPTEDRRLEPRDQQDRDDQGRYTEKGREEHGLGDRPSDLAAGREVGKCLGETQLEEDHNSRRNEGQQVEVALAARPEHPGVQEPDGDPDRGREDGLREQDEYPIGESGAVASILGCLGHGRLIGRT